MTLTNKVVEAQLASGERILMKCDGPHCLWRFTVKTEEERVYWLAQHNCPWTGGETKVSWSVTKTLVEQMWDKLDAEVRAMKGHWNTDKGTWEKPTPIDPEYHKHRARAFAECIAIFMKPFFETADDVVRESIKRWEAHRDNDDEYCTPGIGARRYEGAAAAHLSAVPGWYGTAQDGYSSDPAMAGSPSRNRGRGASTRTATVPVAPTVSDTDRDAMKKAHEAMPQIFTAQTLATQYKLPLELVKKILGA